MGSWGDMGNRRGRLTVESERKEIIASIKETLGSGACLGPACEMMGISTRTYQRWSRPDPHLALKYSDAQAPLPSEVAPKRHSMSGGGVGVLSAVTL